MRSPGEAATAGSRELRLQIAACLHWLALGCYAWALFSRACLFDHERYGLFLPLGLLAVPCAAVLWFARGQSARAGSIAFGVGIGVLTAGGFFWVRYASYAPGLLVWGALAAAIATLLFLLSAARRVRISLRTTVVAAAFSAGAITFGQGVPDRDPKRGSALRAVSVLKGVASRVSEYVRVHGAPPPTLQSLPTEIPESPGYVLDYSIDARSSGSSAPEGYRLTSRPRQFGRTGCHSFFTDDESRVTWTRRPRPAARDDGVWR